MSISSLFLLTEVTDFRLFYIKEGIYLMHFVWFLGFDYLKASYNLLPASLLFTLFKCCNFMIIPTFLYLRNNLKYELYNYQIYAFFFQQLQIPLLIKPRNILFSPTNPYVYADISILNNADFLTQYLSSYFQNINNIQVSLATNQMAQQLQYTGFSISDVTIIPVPELPKDYCVICKKLPKEKKWTCKNDHVTCKDCMEKNMKVFECIIY
jgi:hypothetical protein